MNKNKWAELQWTQSKKGCHTELENSETDNWIFRILDNFMFGCNSFKVTLAWLPVGEE